MRLVETGGVFFFHFRNLETVKIIFLIYIQFGKLKIFIFLEKFWKTERTKRVFNISAFLEKIS